MKLLAPIECLSRDLVYGSLLGFCFIFAFVYAPIATYKPDQLRYEYLLLEKSHDQTIARIKKMQVFCAKVRSLGVKNCSGNY